MASMLIEAREPVLVDAARVLVEGRVGEDVVPVEPLTVGEMADALAVAGMRLVALEQREPRGLGRPDEPSRGRRRSTSRCAGSRCGLATRIGDRSTGRLDDPPSLA